MRRHGKASFAAFGSGRSEEGSLRGSGSRASSALIALTLGITLLCLLPVAASAKFIHNRIGSFGSAAQPSFQNAGALAVDQSNGDLLVVDQAAGTISRFKPDGTPDNFSALGTNVIDGSDTPQGSLSFGSPRELQVAIDESGGPADGNIYVPLPSIKAVDVFAASGAYLGQLTHYNEGNDASGPAKEFDEPCGVAVDPSGNLYVGDFAFGGSIHKYAPSGSLPAAADNSANLPFQLNCALVAGAGPTAGFVFPMRYFGFMAKLDSTSGEEKYVVNPESSMTASVNPATGHVYTAVEGQVREYDASGASEAKLLSSISFGENWVNGVAVDESTGNVYLAREGNPQIEVWGPAVVVPEVSTEAPSAVTPNGAVLHGTISAADGPSASCEFQYTTESAFNEKGFQGGSSLPCSPAGPFTGSATTDVSASVTGLTSGSSYRFRIVGTNSNGTDAGQALKLQTIGPVISAVTFSAITETAATIGGEVDPHGNPTAFTVEYVTDADFQANGFANATSFPLPPEGIGSGNKPVEVSTVLEGLSPDTAYHFRLAAFSEFGGDPVDSFSSGGVFTTFPVGTGLPEGRAYEMVSPSIKIGEVFPPEPSQNLNGSNTCGLEYCNPGFTDIMMPFQVAPDGNSLLYVGQPFSTGLAPSGNQYLSKRSTAGWSTRSITPSEAIKGERNGFKGYSPDLSRGVLLQTSPAFSPDAPIGEGGKAFPNLYLWEDGNPNLRPLVTTEPPERNTFSFGLFFGGGNSGAAGAPAFSHLAFEATDALTPAVPGIAPAAPLVEEGPPCEDPGASCNIYEWVDGQLRLVNVLPGNAAAANHAVIGSGKQLALPIPEAQSANTDHAISADGSRIFWSDESGQVYVRVDGEETVKIEDPGQFLTATPDGSKVLLNNGCVYSLASESCEETLGNSPSAFLGILGASEDLSRIYFVDKEALAPGAQAQSCERDPNGEGEEGGEGKVPPGRGCNVYVFDHGQVRFIATLVALDNIFGLGGGLGDWKSSPSDRLAQVSADGRYLAFMSQARLTGYDNRRANGKQCASGVACLEVYHYDLDSHSLTCASCNPSGLRPLGKSTLSLTRASGSGSLPQLRNLPTEGEGQVFFESTDALSTADRNGTVQDVYEWQPNGVGGCKRAKGCVSLISDGNNASDAFFLSSSASGDDAFFITREPLLLKDRDDLYDAYDARIGGGIEENLPAPCLGEACKGPATSAPEGQSAGSAQFSGPGNEKPNKKKAKKHKKKSKKHKKQSKKKAHKRSAKHNRGGQK